jgi:hypothetical protein
MRLDISTTLRRINKIKKVLLNKNDVTIKDLAKQSNLPETTTSLYVQNYLKDICLIKKIGREKRVSLIKNKSSLFESNLEKQNSKLDLAKELRKKGFSYSEIKERLVKQGFYMGNGTLSENLRGINIDENSKGRYLRKIQEDRTRAGKIGGKIRVSMNDFKNLHILGTEAVKKKAIERIPESSKKLTKEKIWIIGHCIFDGSVINKNRYAVIAYTNKSRYLINKFKKNMLGVYHLEPTDIWKREGGVYVIRYCSIAVVRDINTSIKQEIPEFIMNSKRNTKLLFLKTFWDDEGAIHFGITKDKKEHFHININIEAFCENNKIREQLIRLHGDIGIPIINYGKKIRISTRKNIIRFKKEISFSPRIYLSYPKSKFHGWEKRKLLNFGLNFKHKDASDLYRKLWM